MGSFRSIAPAAGRSFTPVFVPLTGKVIVNVLLGDSRKPFCSRKFPCGAFCIMKESGTDVVGLYNTVFMQRGKAGGKRDRKNFCRSGKSVFDA